MPLPDDNVGDDRALMLRAKRGDRAAFEELVRHHQRPLVNFFYRCGVYNDAEDLAQQTFIRLYRYRQRYQPRAKLETFLYLLARQVLIDETRRRGRAEKLRLALAAEPRPEYAPATPPERGGGLDLDAALAALPEEMRLVVVLGVYQSMPYAEIARVLRIAQGTVKSRMFYALRLLREKLADEKTEK